MIIGLSHSCKKVETGDNHFDIIEKVKWVVLTIFWVVTSEINESAHSKETKVSKYWYR